MKLADIATIEFAILNRVVPRDDGHSRDNQGMRDSVSHAASLVHQVAF